MLVQSYVLRMFKIFRRKHNNLKTLKASLVTISIIHPILLCDFLYSMLTVFLLPRQFAPSLVNNSVFVPKPNSRSGVCF